MAEAAANVLHRTLQLVAPRSARIREHAQLLVALFRPQIGDAHAHAANRPLPAIAFPEKRHGTRDHFPGQRRGTRELALADEAVQRAVAHGELHHAAPQAVLAQPFGHALGEHRRHPLHVPLAGQIPRRRGAVAHGFNHRRIVRTAHRRAIQPVGERPEHLAVFAHHRSQLPGRTGGQIADGSDVAPAQPTARGRADVQKLAHRQRPDLLPKVLRRDDRGRVRLFHVAAQLGEDLIIGNAHGQRKPQLPLRPRAQLRGDLFAAEGMTRHVQPRFVQSEGLDIVGVFGVDFAHHLRKAHVFWEIRRHDLQLRALLPCLPDGLAGGHAHPLGGHVFGQHDAVARVGIAADGHGKIAKRRIVDAFDAGVKIVQVAVQNGSHDGFPLFFSFKNVCSILLYHAFSLFCNRTPD